MTEPTAVSHPHNWAPSDSAAGSSCLTPGCLVVRRPDQLGFDCGPCWPLAYRQVAGDSSGVHRAVGDAEKAMRDARDRIEDAMSIIRGTL